MSQKTNKHQEDFKHAPLSNTGSLVPRRIISVSSVGQRQMYDLEVSHPKHNFLLQNGIVTSNSETLIHFYPIDKRKMYRANKLIGKNLDSKESIDYNSLSKGVNKGMLKSHKTNSSELANILAAQSCMSIDSTVTNEEEEVVNTKTNSSYTSKFSGAPEDQPDSVVETNEAFFKMGQAIESHLNVFEQKFLKMKGVNVYNY